MRIFGVTPAAFASALLVAAVYSPAAWSATSGLQADAMSTRTEVRVQPGSHSWFEPSDGGSRRGVATNCKAQQLYSQHDVVGNPHACLMGGGPFSVTPFGAVLF